MAPREWKDLTDEERAARLKAMYAVAPRNTAIMADFPWRGKIAIDGHFTLSDLRALLAAAEGADATSASTPSGADRDLRTITHASELIAGLRAIVTAHGDLPISVSTTEQLHDDTKYGNSTVIWEPDERNGVCEIDVDI